MPCVCTTGGPQALPDASMALQQTHDSTVQHTSFPSSSEQHGPADAALQPNPDTLQSTGMDTDLSAFLSGALCVSRSSAASDCPFWYCSIYICTWTPAAAHPCATLTAVAVVGMRSQHGLNNRSAVQVIEDALSTNPEMGYTPAMAPSPMYDSPRNPAPNFQQEQAPPSPRRQKHASSQAIVPAGQYSLITAVLQMHVRLLLRCHTAQQQQRLS